MFGLALLLSHFAGARALPSLVGFVPLLLIATSGLSPRATVVVQCLILGSVLFAWWWGTVAIRIPSAAAAAGVGAVGFFVSLLGNWVHLSFMLMAAVLALLWAIAWWATPSLSANSRLGLILSGTAGLFLGCVFSPYGIPLTLERSRIVEAVCRDLITEWMSIFTFIRNGQYQVLVTTVLAIVALIISVTWVALLIRREGRFDPRVRLVLPLAVFGSIAMVAGLGTVRFIAVGAVALLPVAAGATTWIVDRFRHYQRKGLGFWGRPRVVEFMSGRFLTALVLLVGILMTPLAGIRIATGARPAEVAVIEMLPEKCNVWSEDRAAGLVILIRPDVKVWIDGRVDYYGREHLLRYLRILSGKESLPDDAGCVILPTVAYERTALGNILDENREWTRIAQQDGYVLWVRD